jgi:putative NADH-flavin reductase
MRLTIFGATGGVGGELVRQALAAGHQVTAVVRDATRLNLRHPALTMATVPDLTAPGVLNSALEGSQAALSGIGPRGRKDGPVASTTSAAILATLETTGPRRLVVVSAVPVGPVPAGESFVNRRLVLPFINAVAGNVFRDLTAMEAAIQRSNCDWTIVRPPRLVTRPVTGRYRTLVGGNVPRGYLISRADTAHAMLAALDDPRTVRQAVGIAY